MNVVLVCSHPADSLRRPLAARPARLATGLRDLLRASGQRVELVVLPPRASTTASAAAALVRQRSELTAADVVHALDVLAGAAALRARVDTRVPTVVDVQPCGVSTLSAPDRSRWLACSRAADALTVPTRLDAVAARDLGVAAERVHVVASAAAGEVPAAPTLAAPSGERLVSVLSGAHAWGGTVDVVAAMARIRGTRLVVAGRSGIPEAGRRLEAVASAFGVSDRVSVVGWLSSHDTDELVARSAVVVAPRRSLTSGAASLRAMGRGRPVVAYDTPAQAEIVVDGETGLLVPNGSRAALTQAIAAILSDPFRQEAMGQAGQDRVVARFGAEPTSRALDDIYTASRRGERLAC